MAELMLREMAYVLKLSVIFGWFWKASCILALSIFYLTSSCFFRGRRAVRGRSLEMLAPCSLNVLFLPLDLMCFRFEVMSLRRLKKWCKFFQVVLSQLHFLPPGMGDNIACTIFLVADVAVGYSRPLLLADSLPVSQHLCRHNCPGARWWPGSVNRPQFQVKNTLTPLFLLVIYNLDRFVDLV